MYHYNKKVPGHSYPGTHTQFNEAFVSLFYISCLSDKDLLPIHDIQSLLQPIDALTLEIED